MALGKELFELVTPKHSMTFSCRYKSLFGVLPAAEQSASQYLASNEHWNSKEQISMTETISALQQMKSHCIADHFISKDCN